MTFAVIPPVANRLRVMTYNIRSARGSDDRCDIARVADVIRSFAPDLVALQEVDVGHPRSAGMDQAAELGRRLGMEAHFAPTVEAGTQRFGIATLTRLRTLDARQILLPHHHRLRTQPRCALATRHHWDGGEIELINTHLSTLFRERPGQLAAIEREMLAEALLVAGDFNCTPFSPAFRAMRRGLRSATRFARTWPAGAPFAPIDHILYRGRLRVVSAGAWSTADAKRASDHLPVVAELEHVEMA